MTLSSDPIVSWLLPVRDGDRWLQRAVSSTLAECAPQDEIWVIDDGSRRPVASWLAPDDRLRVCRRDAGGIVAALEWGRRQARGSILARIDADDEVLSGRRAAQLAWLRDHPEAGGVGGGAELVNDQGGPPSEGMRRYVDWVNGIRDHRAALLIESPLFHPSMMMRAGAVEAVGGYRDGDFPEDYDLWLRLAGAGFSLGAVHQPVIRIRDHGGRLTRTDPRYRRQAFTQLRMDWAARHLIRPGMRVAVWGAGRSGRPWRRFVLDQDCDLVAVYDLQAGGMRQGRTVQKWTDLADDAFDLLLVAVGVASARREIREAIKELRPSLKEGVHWWAVS